MCQSVVWWPRLPSLGDVWEVTLTVCMPRRHTGNVGWRVCAGLCVSLSRETRASCVAGRLSITENGAFLHINVALSAQNA